MIAMDIIEPHARVETRWTMSLPLYPSPHKYQAFVCGSGQERYYFNQSNKLHDVFCALTQPKINPGKKYNAREVTMARHVAPHCTIKEGAFLYCPIKFLHRIHSNQAKIRR